MGNVGDNSVSIWPMPQPSVNCVELLWVTGPDLRGGLGPRLPPTKGPPTKPYIFYFSLMINAYEL